MQKIVYPLLILLAAAILALTNTGCTSRAKAAYHLERGNHYFAAGEFDKAEIEYINVLRHDGANAQAIGRLGVIYYDRGDLQRAGVFLVKGSELATNDLDLRLKAGLFYLAAGRAKEARDAASYVLGRKPQDPQAPLLLVAASTTQKEMEETRQKLQEMSRKADSAPLEVALGNLYLRQRDFKNAEADFRQAEKLDPKFDETYAAMAGLDLAQKNLKEAESNLQKAAELAPDRSSLKIQYAQFEIQTGHLDAGKKILDDMVKKTPDYLPAWLVLGQVALAEKKFTDSSDAINKVLDRDPNNYDAGMLDARLNLAQGRTETAITELEKMTRNFPNVPQPLYQLALAYLANNDAGKATASLNRALNINTNFTEAALLLAQVQIQTGNADSAISSLRQMIGRQPELGEAQLLLAEAYGVQGKSEAAIEIYQRLQKAFPQNPQIPMLMGVALLQEKNNDGARAEFTLAQKLAPDSFPPLEQLVNLDLADKQYVAAQQRLQTAIEKNPKNAQWQLLLSKVFIAQGNNKEAETALLKACELAPASDAPYLMLSQLYNNEKQNDKALATVKTAVQKNPKSIPGLMLLGVIYNEQKEYQNAAEAYEKCLAINPNLGPVLNNLAYLYCENLGDLDKAYDLAQRARTLAPNDPSTADTLGWVLFKKGQYSSALSLLQDSASKLTKEPEAQFHLGMANYMLGNEDAARAAFQSALQLNPEFAYKDQCHQCLSVLAIDPKTAGAAELSMLQKVFTQQPNDPVALSRLAAIYRSKGDAAKLTAVYESALKANPQNGDVMIQLANLYSEKDPQRALALARNAYNLLPGNSMASYTLGRMAYRTGNYPLAFSLLQDIARNQPNNAGALFEFARAAYSVGKVPDAETAMKSAVQAGLPSSESDQAGQFMTFIDLAKNPAQAVAAQSRIEQVLKSNPEYVPALMASGIVSEQKNDLAAASQIYEKILGLYPDFAPAQRNLAMIYSRMPGKSDRAYALATKARDSFPNDSSLTRTLGILVYQQGDYGRAADLFQTALTGTNGDAELYYYLGMAQYHLKNTAQSKTSLERALNLNLSGKEADEARRILQGIK